MARFELELKTWTSDPPVTGYKEVYGKESHGSKGAFGIRIFVTIDHEISKEAPWTEAIAISKAAELIEEAIRTEDERLSAESQKAKADERRELLGVFPDVFQFEELPNGYCNKWCCTQKPWYRVLTRVGWVKIGWRKSVINIDWSDTAVKQSGDELFPGAQFTVGSGYDHKGNPTRYCHAYGVEKAREQLAVVLNAPPKV